jgi:cell wall-associated NlpC family hydrolase
MALIARICLLALCLVPVAAATAAAQPGRPAAAGPPALPAVADPARLPGSVPLTPLPAAKREPPSLGERAVRIAARELGTPYRYGGNSPGGFDCSGLTSYVYGRLGIELPHNAAAQYGHGRPVDRDELRPGDLVFFHGLGHVGLYVGRGRMIHAPQSGQRVEIQSLAARSGSVRGARRIVS